MSFASEPGRDDGNLPPVNVVIPDDARELDRDVLAYRRERRAQRRRQRLHRMLRPFRVSAFGGHAAIIPAIAVCLAISLVGGALLSVVTMSPAAAPTTSTAQPTGPAENVTKLPSGTVQLDGRSVPARSLIISAIALVPVNCDCGTQLGRLAGQAVAAHVGLYFAAAGAETRQLSGLVADYGHGAAVTVTDNDSVLTAAYRPQGLTVLLVFKDATVEVFRTPGADFQLTAVMRTLNQPGAGQTTTS